MSTRLLRTGAFASSLALGLALLAGITLVPRLAHAASFSVTDCSQYGTASTAGTLAKAFADAAASADPSSTITFGCDTSGGGIVFPAAISPTKSLTLDATGHNVTLSGGNATQLFSMTGTGSETLTLNHLTITAGNVASGIGGAIQAFNINLVVNDCTFGKNSASDLGGGAGGAIGALGTNITITGSTFANNTAILTSTPFGPGVTAGGAIVAIFGSQLMITNSTFSGNAASGGGAIGGAVATLGTPLWVTSSTFTGNTVTATTTSLFGFSGGGAIAMLDSGSTSAYGIGNSTITGNTVDGGTVTQGAGGGLVIEIGTTPLDLTNDTIVANTVKGKTTAGSNIATAGTSTAVTVTNTILADGQGASNCDVALVDGGHNIDSGMSCGFAAGSSNLDPKLGALAYNGGPTQTMALLAKSPAIDAGDDTACGSDLVGHQDQRGVARPQGLHCDIGAYEAIPAIATTTSLKANATSATCGRSVMLTATVSAVGVVPTGGTVTFKDGGTTLGTATLNKGTATFSTTKLDNGAHSLTAVYSGTSTTGMTAGFLTSTSTAVTVTVTGCQGLGGLGPAPSAPQQPQAPSAPSTSNSPSTSSGPATLPSASQVESQWSAVAPKGHPTTAATSPSFPVQLILLIAGLLLAGIGATGLVVNRRRLV